MKLTDNNFDEFYMALPKETKLLWDDFQNDSEEATKIENYIK